MRLEYKGGGGEKKMISHTRNNTQERRRKGGGEHKRVYRIYMQNIMIIFLIMIFGCMR
jgi:hypothetical protein